MVELSTLRRAFQRAMTSPYSSFYRDLYASRMPFSADFPRTWDEWASLPFLTKKDMQDVSFYGRQFIPVNHVDVIRMTSGTTSSGILLMPRANFRYIPRLHESMPCLRMMNFFFPHHTAGVYKIPDMQFIGGDAARLEMSAALAARIQIDAIGGMSSLLIAFAPVLAQRYDTARIRWLALSSDKCTGLQEKALHRYYPNAKIVNIYTSTEAQGYIAISPPEPVPGYPFAVEPLPDYYHLELIDEADAPIDTELTLGSLIVSSVHPEDSFPLLRYRSGDSAVRVFKDKSRELFNVTGRVELDRIRFAGGTIMAEEVERAVEAVAGGFATDFEAAVSEEMIGGHPLPKLTVTLVLADDTVSLELNTIAQHLSEEIRINQRRTYAESVEGGFSAPLECKTTLPALEIMRKRRRLVDTRTS